MDTDPKIGNEYFMPALLVSGPDADALYRLRLPQVTGDEREHHIVVERFAHELEAKPRAITHHERYVVERLVEAAQAFRELPGLDESDRADFNHAIQQAQRIVLARPGIEDYNDHHAPPFTP